MAKPAANHLLGRLLERPVGSGVDQPLGEVVANELCVEILIGAAGVQQVALGDDARTAGRRRGRQPVARAGVRRGSWPVPAYVTGDGAAGVSRSARGPSPPSATVARAVTR